jgi:murein L,D-transpeptidase YafK
MLVALAAALASPDLEQGGKQGGLEPPAGEETALAPLGLLPASAPADRARRLGDKGMAAGSPVLIRIFKAESELELWLEKQGRFELFATYPICFWSGALGPKLREGDRQAPEGLYAVGLAQLHLKGRHPRSLDLGFPNPLDQALARTGSYILVHGGCKSIGCFAMTDPVMEEIYALSERALREGQAHIQVHVFPFRMSEANLALQTESAWYGFWRNLKDAYDAFERTRIPPSVRVCRGRYIVGQGIASVEEAAAPGLAPVSAAGCDTDEAEIARLKAAEAQHVSAFVGKGRRIAGRWRYRRAAKRRGARAAYAAARRARMAAHARRAQ